MTINKTAYDTRACAGFDTAINKAKAAVEKAMVIGWISNVDQSGMSGGSSGYVLSVESDRGEIPAFAHPMIVTNSANEEQIVVDLRAYGKWDNAQAQFNIRNLTEYKLAVYRAKLNDIWVKHGPTILRDISKLPLTVFASWISEGLARRFFLDPGEQLKIAILSAIFYHSQFSNREVGEKMDEREKMRVVNSTSQALRVKAQDVLIVLDKVDYIPNITVFCALAEEISGSVRLKELNVGLLFSVVASSWFGGNAKELITVALEHPPTWISILMAATTERNFKNSVIAKLIERQGREAGKDFLLPVLRTLRVDEY